MRLPSETSRPLIAGAALALALASCTQVVRSVRAHPVFEAKAWERRQRPLPELPATDFAFQSLGPVDFLNHLVRLHHADGDPSRGTLVTIEGTHRGWIEARDLRGLEALLDSTEPCAAVVMATSSYLPMDPSTVGREAAAMIEAHRAEALREGYAGWPVRLQADPYPDREALRAWAREHGG